MSEEGEAEPPIVEPQTPTESPVEPEEVASEVVDGVAPRVVEPQTPTESTEATEKIASEVDAKVEPQAVAPDTEEAVATRIASKTLKIIEEKMEQLERTREEFSTSATALLSDAIVKAHEHATSNVIGVYDHIERELSSRMAAHATSLGHIAACSATSSAIHPFEHQVDKLNSKMGEVMEQLDRVVAAASRPMSNPCEAHQPTPSPSLNVRRRASGQIESLYKICSVGVPKMDLKSGSARLYMEYPSNVGVAIADSGSETPPVASTEA